MSIEGVLIQWILGELPLGEAEAKLRELGAPANVVEALSKDQGAAPRKVYVVGVHIGEYSDAYVVTLGVTSRPEKAQALIQQTLAEKRAHMETADQIEAAKKAFYAAYPPRPTLLNMLPRPKYPHGQDHRQCPDIAAARAAHETEAERIRSVYDQWSRDQYAALLQHLEAALGRPVDPSQYNLGYTYRDWLDPESYFVQDFIINEHK